jgi:outer membrane protein assembly factor BamB
VAAAGRIYFTAQDGTTLVFKEGDKLELLSTNKLNDPIDASPVAAGKQLFLRSHGRLYCIEEK